MRKGKLILSAKPGSSGALLAFKTLSNNYQANVTILKSTASAGIALVGDDKNMVRLIISEKGLSVSKLENDNETILAQQTVPGWQKMHLRMDVNNGKEISFAYSTDGSAFLNLDTKAIDGYFLPPWDRAVRIGLIAQGDPSRQAVFESFVLKNR